ncbi:hypothetical protein SmJEL517_g03713 [Synchytrium microbalum]|uniref:UFSP1/2/DUB catalytic domain-containing protein n=1 Tax=Synchytrium microbalum TaxID=1806994 RepID=A0A507C702_9FUNG|nr:uncharacterized protein SmJEL517_g03713 [Synchytrium microbalum]TPX33313.1 hypothetical protein SmJEL517_g03713 [Synchytrium microbalum]
MEDNSECPVCSRLVPLQSIENHVNSHFEDARPTIRACPNCMLQVPSDAFDDHVMQHTLALMEEENELVAQETQNPEFEMPWAEMESSLGRQQPSSAAGDSSSTTPAVTQQSSDAGSSSNKPALPNSARIELVRNALVDCPRSITGIIPRLEAVLKISQYGPTKGTSPNTTTSAYLCLPATTYFPYPAGDRWGCCGYLNLQNMMSSILGSQYGSHLAEQLLEKTNELKIPSIPRLQQYIERAWKQGIDPDGARQLQNRLVDTRKWIGASETAALLKYFNVKIHVLEIINPDPDGSHTSLLDFVQRYFEGEENPIRIRPSIAMNGIRVSQDLPCLFLQHQGHSRTIVGIEKIKSDKRNLLLFDPSKFVSGRLCDGPPPPNGSIPFGDAQKMLNGAFRLDDAALRRNAKYQIVILAAIQTIASGDKGRAVAAGKPKIGDHSTTIKRTNQSLDKLLMPGQQWSNQSGNPYFNNDRMNSQFYTQAPKSSKREADDPPFDTQQIKAKEQNWQKPVRGDSTAPQTDKESVAQIAQSTRAVSVGEGNQTQPRFRKRHTWNAAKYVRLLAVNTIVAYRRNR